MCVTLTICIPGKFGNFHIVNNPATSNILNGSRCFITSVDYD